MDYELIKDENGKVMNVKINGEDVKKSFIRGLKNAQKTSFWKEYRNVGIFENPFSGIAVELNPFEASIYSWCLNWYRRYSAGDMPCPIQTYDDMRYFFRELNGDAYYDLLD